MSLTRPFMPTYMAFLFVGLGLTMNGKARAIPPSPHAIKEVQPDGTKIDLYLRGNAKQNWYEDEKGYTVVRGPSRYVYALRGRDGHLVSTRLLVGKANPSEAGLKPGIRPSPEVIDEMRKEAQRRDDVDNAGRPKASSIPATPHAVAVQQPDGTDIKLRLRGDEWFHWYEDTDGYTVIEEPGSFVYATLGSDGSLAPTDLVVGKADPAESGLKPHIRPKPKPVDEDSPMPTAPSR